MLWGHGKMTKWKRGNFVLWHHLMTAVYNSTLEPLKPLLEVAIWTFLQGLLSKRVPFKNWISLVLEIVIKKNVAAQSPCRFPGKWEMAFLVVALRSYYAKVLSWVFMPQKVSTRNWNYCRLSTHYWQKCSWCSFWGLWHQWLCLKKKNITMFRLIKWNWC